MTEKHDYGVEAYCEWREEDQWGPMAGTYESACGQAWAFTDGGPAENNVRFCQGCGKPVNVIPFPQPPEEADEAGVAVSPETRSAEQLEDGFPRWDNQGRRITSGVCVPLPPSYEGSKAQAIVRAVKAAEAEYESWFPIRAYGVLVPFKAHQPRAQGEKND